MSPSSSLETFKLKAFEEERPMTALVTGGAKRIGSAFVKLLCQKGIKVVLHYNTSHAEAQALCNHVNAQNPHNPLAFPLRANLIYPMERDALFAQAYKLLGRPVDVLIHSASIFENDTLKTLSQESFSKHMDIHLTAGVFLAQNFVKQKRSHAQNTQIIYLVDQNCVRAQKSFLSYQLSKNALYDLTRHLALSLAPHTRVNAIAPGPSLPNTYQSEAEFQEKAKQTPLEKIVPLKGLEDALWFLIQSTCVTGQVLFVDSGAHLV